jgi:neuralized-like protein 4
LFILFVYFYFIVIAMQVNGCYGVNLDSLHSSHLVGVLVDSESRLHLFVNGVDQGVAVCDIPAVCYAVVDLYGQCEEVRACVSWI